MASGRFVNKSIAEDNRLARLSIMAEYVFLKTIPHLDRDGMITGQAPLLFSRTHPTRSDLYGQTQTFIDEWIAVGLVILFNTPEGPALFFPGFAKNNKLPHYDRETPSRFPPPPGYAHDGKDGPLYPAHQKPPSKTPKKPKQVDAPPEERAPDTIVGNSPFGRADILDEVMDEVQELLQESVQDEVQELVQQSVDEVHPKVEVKDQVEDQGKKKINTNTNLRALAHSLMIPEWNGGGGDVDALPDKQLLVAALWLWHYRKLKEVSGIYRRNEYAEAYRPGPFAGVDNPVGFIREQIKRHNAPHLRAAHRAEFDAEVRKVQP